jgi:DNA-binding response OmpR family regulator
MQNESVRVLLAEDDEALGDVIKDNLDQEGYAVTWCRNGQEALSVFDRAAFDICLLDVMMPEKDGFTVAKRIRQQSDVVPIIFLTARSMEEDKIKGFQTGADDYITKPFSIKELVLRMEVFLRRTRKLQADQPRLYVLGALQFNFTDLKIEGPLEKVNLTQREADLLKFFCDHPNSLLKREEVLLNVWGKDDYFLGRSMDVFIAKLRKYCKQEPAIVLETVHGVGFRFNADVRRS